MKWIHEVLHYCAGLPIMLLGLKKDLGSDPATIDELLKTSQQPVSWEQVRLYIHTSLILYLSNEHIHRAKPQERKSARLLILNVLRRQGRKLLQCWNVLSVAHWYMLIKAINGKESGRTALRMGIRYLAYTVGDEICWHYCRGESERGTWFLLAWNRVITPD
jgi:hypothetical protein